jgi:hypothetical protein
VEKTAIEQATDNAILDQLGKVVLLLLKQPFNSEVFVLMDHSHNMLCSIIQILLHLPSKIPEICPNLPHVCLVG